MYITVLGKRYQLGEKKVVRSTAKNDLNDLLAENLGRAELRVLRILCDDSIIDKDTATAADVFGVPEWQVTPVQREVGKQRNFRVLYGEL